MAQSQDVQFSRHGGLTMSYIRFIADGGPGLLLLLFILVETVRNELPVSENDVLIVFASVLLFLLALPLGLILNGIGWFLWGFLSIRLTCWLLDVGRLVHRVTGEHHCLRETIPYFGIRGSATGTAQRGWGVDAQRLFSEASRYEQIFLEHHPDGMGADTHVLALERFLRGSLAFLLFVFFYYAVIAPDLSFSFNSFPILFWTFLLIIFLFAFLVMIGFYRATLVLLKAYVWLGGEPHQDQPAQALVTALTQYRTDAARL